MESAIHVGNKVDKETASNISSIIEAVFDSGKKNSMDQSTIVAAIKMIGTITEVKNVTITNSNFTGDKVINMDANDNTFDIELPRAA